MHSSKADGISSQVLFQQARAGQVEALGALFQHLRPWLRLLAEGMLGAQVAARIDPSDIIQLTCLSAHQHFQEFRGHDLPQFMAWLKEIHHRNIQNELRRHVGTAERSVERERPLANVDSNCLASDSPPSRPLLLGEDAVRLAEAMEHLPLAQRRAVALRYLEDLPISRIAQMLDKTPDAVTSLIRRALEQLRGRLTNEP